HWLLSRDPLPADRRPTRHRRLVRSRSLRRRAVRAWIPAWIPAWIRSVVARFPARVRSVARIPPVAGALRLPAAFPAAAPQEGAIPLQAPVPWTGDFRAPVPLAA